MRQTTTIDTIERLYRRRALVAVSRVGKGLWDAPAVIGLWLWFTMLVWQRRDNARRELAAMDASRLTDLGITREQAVREAAKPFWRA